MGVIWKQKFLMHKKSDMYPQYWTPSIGGIFVCDIVTSTRRSALHCTDKGNGQKHHSEPVGAVEKRIKGEIMALLLAVWAAPRQWWCLSPSFPQPKPSRRGGWRSPTPGKAPVLRRRTLDCGICPPGRRDGRCSVEIPLGCRNRCRRHESGAFTAPAQ